LLNEGLPQIVVYDEGYLDDSHTFQLFIATGKVLVTGIRTDGGQIGEYLMTRNVNNPGFAPGAYQKIVDHGDKRVRVNRSHDGHNGGPVLFYRRPWS